MRRFTSLAAAIALAATLLGGVAAHADGPTDVDPTPDISTQSGYWACVAVDHVHVGACLANPLPDPNEYGSLRSIIRDQTGVTIP